MDCHTYGAYCLSNGDGWTRSLGTMWNADDDPIALGVRAAVGDEDLSLVPDSVAWPSGEQLEHLGARYAGLARSFPTLDDYGIRFSDWQYRATPFDEPDLTVLPAWLRDQLGTECADGLDNDGDGSADWDGAGVGGRSRQQLR